MTEVARGLDNVGVAVRDLDASLRFYHDAVGLPVADRDDASRAASLSAGGAQLYVFETSGPGGTRRTGDYTRNPTGLDHLSFAVDDVDATHRQLSGRGVEFFMDPVDAEWGARVCACHDPDGTPVYFLRWNE
jgi:catechol 2,3-dioxygenase-like lactoylglutathione lyase family enzyme